MDAEPTRAVHGASDLSGVRILVVDDEVDTCQSIARILQLRGHTTDMAFTGRDAIRQVTSFSPDLVLLDVTMPGINGLDVARVIRRMKCSKEPVIAAVSGYGEHFRRRLCAQAGFDHFLLKPVDPVAFDHLLWLAKETAALRETFLTLQHERRAKMYALAWSQVEFAGLILDSMTTLKDERSKERHVENVERLQDRTAKWLGMAVGFTPEQKSGLQTLLASLQDRLATIKSEGERPPESQ